MRVLLSQVCNAVCAAFFLFLGMSVIPVSGYAKALYSDEAVSFEWPEDVTLVACEPELAARAGVSCARIGMDGSLGAVFVTKSPGYQLGSEALLSAHLRNSEEALADIPRIHVMQSRVFRVSPLVGLMEILRKDGTLAAVSGLRGHAIRQSSLMIPADDKLYQVFIYLPIDGDDQLYMHLIDSLQISVKLAPRAPENSEVHETQAEGGALSLLPVASGIGLSIACVAILGLRYLSKRRREEREAELQREAAKVDKSGGDFDLSEEISMSSPRNAEVCDFDTSDADSM